MNDAFLWFSAGFACAGSIFAYAAVWYYLRARKRVRSIQAAIEKHNASKRAVDEACARVFRPRG